MNNLFTYGCSFTYGNGCLPYEIYPQNYKKSEDDLIWPEIVSKEIGFNLFNYGMGAISNDIILDTMIETFDEVTEGDVVVIQKTFTHRFDIAYKRQKNEQYARRALTITPESDEALRYQNYDEREIESILYNTWIMDSEFNDMRIDNRFNFLKRLFLAKRVQKCIIWDVTRYQNQNIYERITEATDKKINDAHWSYNGHRAFSKIMVNKILQEPLEVAFNTTKNLI